MTKQDMSYILVELDTVTTEETVENVFAFLVKIGLLSKEYFLLLRDFFPIMDDPFFPKGRVRIGENLLSMVLNGAVYTW